MRSSIFFARSTPSRRPRTTRSYIAAMKSIPTEQIEHIARLARLRFEPDELQGFTAQFNQILAYVEKLGEVDTTGVEPMTGIISGESTLREDEPGPTLSPAEALRNAPKKKEGFFSVPKVIAEQPE
jgi:aspartyl-tRNA(Asn)/glutamyl-tRNA(Gln) amidotransferase subunit C